MRHRKKKGRLNRSISHRKATLRMLAVSLLKYQRIETTRAKAKAVRGYVEKLITLAKKFPDSISARRRVFRKLCDKNIVKLLFRDIAPLFKTKPGGYTRIFPLGTRTGDGADIVIMELTERTIPDEKLLGIETSVKEKVKERKKKDKKAEKETQLSGEICEEKTHAAPEVKLEEKEERVIEDVKKEKAKTEQKKIFKKGFFRRFQRKSMG